MHGILQKVEQVAERRKVAQIHQEAGQPRPAEIGEAQRIHPKVGQKGLQVKAGHDIIRQRGIPEHQHQEGHDDEQHTDKGGVGQLR